MKLVRCISLGGGTQSSAMALMADKGYFKHIPDAAIWADTGWDPPSVREVVDWLGENLTFPVHIVKNSDLAEDTANNITPYGKQYTVIPSYIKDGGVRRRFCTSEYKIKPIIKKSREIAGLKPKQRAKDVHIEQWIGISYDEVHRMKQDYKRRNFVTNRYPLIENKLDRDACIDWWRKNAPGRCTNTRKNLHAWAALIELQNS